jgi:hypothetical protein
MTDTPVTLGGFTFTSFAVPERINGGGRQRMVVHQLIGGTRVVDVMGWDAEQIRFSGRLRGADAMLNARLLETLARSGIPILFSYWTNRYQVVVDTFTWNFERFYEITFSLRLTVIADLTQLAWQAAADTLDDVFGADLQAVTVVASDLPTVAAGLATVATAQAAQGTLQGAGTQALLPLSTAVGSTLSTAQGLQSSLDSGFPAAAAGGVVAGDDPATLASSLSTQAGNMQQLAASTQATAVLTRMQSNLAATPS